MSPTYVEERLYYPSGFDANDEWHVNNVYSWTLGVYYRGDGKWMVSTGREGHRQVSSTGKFLWLPLKMTAMRHCRHDFATACRLAETVIDKIVMNGKTWAEVMVWIEERKAEEAARADA